ncbi:MAG: hypothetical protein OEQ13_14715, partial [Acidobacteriota bacterium]|nr:hypothetical protein [Acidobacteriota bacterium]
IGAEGGHAFVLYDSKRPEAVALALDENGTIWAAFAGRVTEDKRPLSEKEGEPEPGVSRITVRPKNGNGENGEEEKEDKTDDEQTRKGAPRAPAPRGGGELVRLAPGEEPETVWSDGTETPMAIATHEESGVLLGTAKPARVWWIVDHGREGLWTAVNGVQAVSALSRRGSRVALATSNPSAVFAFDSRPTGTASWTSDVLDAGVTSRFGLLHAVVPRGAERGTRVFARAGNSAEPEIGWSAWKKVPDAPAPPEGAGGHAELPRARFLQVRIEIDGGAKSPTGVSRVEARYRGTNRPPRIGEVLVSSPGVAYRPIPPSDVTSGQRPVVEPGEATEAARELNRKGSAWRSKKVYEPGAITVTWQAQDPDGDRLTYDLELCRDEGAPCAAWQTVVEELERSFHSFDGRTLADGVYFFRVRASDAADNFPGDSRDVVAMTDPVVVDHTPPEIVAVDIDPREGGRLHVRVEARDRSGRLASAEVAVRPGTWREIPAKDGVADGASEVFEAIVPDAGGGPSVGIRVTDASGNVSLRRTTR